MKALVDAAFAEEVAFLKALVRVSTDNPPGDCAPAAEVVAELLDGMGFAVERHVAPEPFVRQAGMLSVVNLIVRHVFGDGRGPVVALSAHGDTVPPGEGWTVDPYGAVERDGAVYGRGVAVSKSDFATYAFALRALVSSGLPLAGTVELHFTFDEETGGQLGPPWILAEGHSRPDLALSAGFAYSVTTAHNGVLHLEIVVRGRPAHAAAPAAGVDALEATWPILKALYEERDRLAGIVSSRPGIGSPGLTVGLISGGINTNVVPDRVVMRLDRRLIPEEVGTEVEAALVRLAEAATPRTEGIVVECRRIMLAEPLRPRPGVDHLAETVARHARAVLGMDVPVTGAPLYTDARHYAQAGIPTVLYGAGPRSIAEANAYAADEHLNLDDLRAATEVVALALADLLAVR